MPPTTHLPHTATAIAITIAATLTATPQTTLAINKTWDGGGFGFWNTTADWTPNGVPTTNDNVLIDTSTIVQINAITAEINELELRSGANLATGGNYIHFQKPLTIGNNGITNFNGSDDIAALFANTFTNAGTLNINTGLNEIGTSTTPARLTGIAAGVVNIADGATLILRDVSLIDTAGQMNINGGQVTGTTLTNQHHITGHGTITNSHLVNNGNIHATGGTLTIQTAFNPDLDGTTDNGSLSATNSRLELIFPTSGIPRFAGDITLNANAELTSTNSIEVRSGGSVTLSGGSKMTIDGGYIQQHDSSMTVTGPGTATINSDFFTSFNGTNSINAPLELNGKYFFADTATFSGTGTISVEPDARLALDNGATVAAPIINHARLTPGIFTTPPFAQANLASLTFQDTGSLEIEIDGNLPNIPGTSHDQINITNTLTPNGTLDFTLINPDTPPAYGIEYTAITYGTRTPDTMFDAITGTLINPRRPQPR